MQSVMIGAILQDEIDSALFLLPSFSFIVAQVLSQSLSRWLS